MLIEECPAFATGPRDQELDIGASRAVAGPFSGQDSAVGDGVDGGDRVEGNVDAAMTVAGVAGVPYYPERAYELVAASQVVCPEGEGQIAGRSRWLGLGTVVITSWGG